MKCYTDASFDPVSKIAIVGYIINSSIHPPIITSIINNTTNTKAEIVSIIMLIKKLLEMNIKKATIYTDCQSVINVIKKKNVFIINNFLSKNNKILNNATLYKELFELLDNHTDIIILHIKGHIPTKDMNDDNKIFSVLDKNLRSKLRKIIKQNKTKLN